MDHPKLTHQLFMGPGLKYVKDCCGKGIGLVLSFFIRQSGFKSPKLAEFQISSWLDGIYNACFINLYSCSKI